jgi:hypothetical protein
MISLYFKSMTVAVISIIWSFLSVSWHGFYSTFSESLLSLLSDGRRLGLSAQCSSRLTAYVHMNTFEGMNPKELQELLDELEASRASRKRAWENLQEIRWVLKDTVGTELPPPARKTIDLEGRIVKDGVRKALRDRQLALTELVHAIREYRTIADSKPLTLQGANYAQAVQELNKAIDRAEGLLQ